MDPNPYKPSEQRGKIDNPDSSTQGLGIMQTAYLTIRVVVVFIAAWLLVTGVAMVLIPIALLENSSAAFKFGLPIGCFLTAVALTILDTIQYLRKRGTRNFWV